MRLLLFLIFLFPSLSWGDSESTIGGKTAQAHIVQCNGTSLRPRPYINFTTTGSGCTDANGKTNIALGSGGGGGSAIAVKVNGSTVVASIDTLAFSSNFSGTNSPSGTANIEVIGAGGLNAVQYKGVSAQSGDETKFSFNGTNVGINTTNATGGSLEIVAPASGKNFSISSAAGNNGNLMTILNGGNVGINTANPVAKLQVNATGSQFSVLSNGNVGIGTVNNSITGIFAFSPSGTSVIRMRNNDASSGLAQVQVLNDSNQGATFNSYGSSSAGPLGTGEVSFKNNSTVSDLYVGSSSAVGTNLFTSNAVRLTINSAGNVGMGTTRIESLTVPNNGAGAGKVFVSDAVGFGTWMNASTLATTGGSATPGGGLNAVQTNSPLGSLGGDETKLSANGTNVGIGTTNGLVLLDVRGNVGIGTFRTNGINVEITGNSLTQPTFMIRRGQNETAPFVAVGGNIGIGTTTPDPTGTYRVDINGRLQTSGNINSVSGSFIGTGGSINASGIQAGGQTAASDTGGILIAQGAGISSASEIVNILSDARTVTNNSANLNQFFFNKYVPPVLNGNKTTNNATTLDISGAPSGTTLTPYSSSLRIEQGNVIFGATGTTNVGIGTIDPTGKFQLRGAGEAASYVLQSNAVGVGTWVPSTTLAVVATASPGGSSPQLQYNNASAMGGITNFNSDGTNVGIGTTSYKNSLNTLGNISVGTLKSDGYLIESGTIGNITVQGNIGIGTWKATNSLIVMASGSGGAGNGGGNVGIGTLSPGVSLDVNGTYRGSGSGDSYVQGNFGIGTVIPMNTLSVQGSLAVGTVTYTGTALGTNVAAFSGNVGISSLSPGQNLDVFGTIRTKGLVSFTGNNIKASVKTGANTACNTTCSSGGCLMGEDTSVLGSFVDCADATADRCICLDGTGG